MTFFAAVSPAQSQRLPVELREPPLLWALLRQLPPRAPNLDSAVALNHFGSTELAAQASERLVIEH
ncbi:MAG: hypothetical protein DMG81_13770 [Acidobacteria bacterium]|nr:MAG: hypothetical protein DMG81_13770 [Acidobacteriota bacterium]